MNAMETRKLAQELGFKNVAKFSKAQLETMIAEKQAEIAAAEAAKAKPVKPAKPYFAPGSKGKCAICGRKGDPDSPGDGPLCTPHLTEAYHENAHSDYSHEAIAAEIEQKGGATEDLSDRDLDELKRMNNCWVCNPIFNQATDLAPLGERSGSSRAGMRMTVPVRGAAMEKATAVEAKLAGLGAATTITKGKTLLKLRIMCGPVDIQLAWDALSGAYAYEQTYIVESAGAGSRKVRNVSAALRALGI